MKRILFLLAPVLFVMIAFRPVNSHTITGVVTDDSGQPVVGATIKLKDAAIGCVTDMQGAYKLTVPSSTGKLIVAAVGFITQEIAIKGKTTIHITLKTMTATMQEVVVVGYAAQSKKVLTGSVSNYQPAPVYGYSNLNTQLQGKVAGVQITGNPGRSNQLLTRGMDKVKKEDKQLYDANNSDFEREGYDLISENQFLKATENPLSTFSIDVDAASYSNVRRFLNNGQLPPAGAVRIEEMVNYFNYTYPQPTSNAPFSINTEIADAPWNKNHKLVLIGLQGKKIPTENLPASNLVFLIDVSGSMSSPNKLPLVKASMKMLVDQLRPQDKVAMVVYAGAAGLVLPPTSGADKMKIKEAIDQLESGGSTAGGAGIMLAYKTAKEHFVKEGNNRVILCTDGDFNVGASSDDAMERMIENERKSGVFLTVLGYGMGNYQDAKMQKLADKGNGNHAYIDGITEAKKVLVNEFGGTLFTIAKDVKLQLEFNPANIQGYRLIGYENRMLAKEDFNDDQKDAGELGSGHTVTALYEVIPVGVKSDFLKSVDPLKYQKETPSIRTSDATNELLTVKFRYKAPDGDVSQLITHPVMDQSVSVAQTSDNFRFAAAVAEFGLLLRNSAFKSASSFDNVLRLARKAKGKDEQGYRSEFIRLVESAQLIGNASATEDDDDEEPADRPLSKFR